MATLTQFLPYDNGSFTNFKLWAQGISNAFTTFGWVPSSDSGLVGSTGNYGTATITNIAITSNVLTVTFSGATFNFASGQVVQLTGLTTNTFLNGQYVMVQNSGTPANDHTTTTFLAGFTHANVGSVADTGTITALYNWNTITNVADSTETGNYSLKQPKKFRGNWVGTTPTFTNLQTTNNQTTITMATPHGLDLTKAVGQGLFVVNVANANFTFLNTNPTSPVTGIYAGCPFCPSQARPSSSIQVAHLVLTSHRLRFPLELASLSILAATPPLQSCLVTLCSTAVTCTRTYSARRLASTGRATNRERTSRSGNASLSISLPATTHYHPRTSSTFESSTA